MSYKFQRGAAILSGSITAEDGLDAGSSGLASAGAIAGGTTANFSGVVTAGGLTVGSAELIEAELEMIDGITAGTAAASKAVVLDASKNIATIGTIGCGAITSTGASSFAGGITPAAADGAALGSAALEWSDLYLADGGRINLGNEQDVFIEHVADEGIRIQSTNAAADKPTKLQMNFSSSSPADDDLVGLIQMDGYDDAENPQTWAKIEVQSTDVTHGSEDSTLQISVATAGVTNAGLVLEGQNTNGVVNATVGLGAASTVTIPGNLTVNGTTTTINSTTVQIDDLNLQLADGAAAAASVDGGGITLATSGDDFTFQYNHATTAWKSSIDMDLATGKTLKIAGTQVLSATALAATVVVDGDSLSINSCNASLDNTTIADADLFIVADANASNAAKKITAADVKSFLGDGLTATETEGFRYANYDVTSSAFYNANGRSGVHVASGSSAANPTSASAGVNPVIHLSGGAGGWVNGTIVTIKAPSNASTHNVTIMVSGAVDKIDGEVEIKLESDYAAVSLIRTFNNTWSII